MIGLSAPEACSGKPGGVRISWRRREEQPSGGSFARLRRCVPEPGDAGASPRGHDGRSGCRREHRARCFSRCRRRASLRTRIRSWGGCRCTGGCRRGSGCGTGSTDDHFESTHGDGGAEGVARQVRGGLVQLRLRLRVPVGGAWRGGRWGLRELLRAPARGGAEVQRRGWVVRTCGEVTSSTGRLRRPAPPSRHARYVSTRATLSRSSPLAGSTMSRTSPHATVSLLRLNTSSHDTG